MFMNSGIQNISLNIFVISVKRYIDRHDSVNSQMKELGLNFEFIFSNDPENFIEKDLDYIKHNSLTIGATSCVLKHVNAWKKFANSDSEFALILEDDVIFRKNFLQNLEKTITLLHEIEPSFLVFLGGADNKLNKKFFESNTLNLIEFPISTTEGYIIDQNSAHLRLDWLLRHNKIQDAADHFLKKIDKKLGIKQYRTSFPILQQGSLYGKFISELDINRSKHGRLYIFTRFHWKKFRKQTLPRFLTRLFTTNYSSRSKK